jgi:hypothetical protein
MIACRLAKKREVTIMLVTTTSLAYERESFGGHTRIVILEGEGSMTGNEAG